MINNNEIQKQAIARLKADASLLSLLTHGTDEIREDQWQGTTWVYPCIRVQLGTQIPVAGCSQSAIPITILCYSEDASSIEVNELAWAAHLAVGDKSFKQGTIRFSSWVTTGLMAAIQEGGRTWRAENRYNVRVSLV